MELPYFKLGEAFKEVKDAFSYGSTGEKAEVLAKLTAKTVANVGLLAVDFGVEIVKRAPEISGKIADTILNHENSHKLTDEQRNNLNETIKKGEEHRKERKQNEIDKS